MEGKIENMIWNLISGNEEKKIKINKLEYKIDKLEKLIRIATGYMKYEGEVLIRTDKKKEGFKLLKYATQINKELQKTKEI